jgi:hypothetical protein
LLVSIGHKSGFASERAKTITKKAELVFGDDANATFSTFKKRVHNTSDYVLYDDVKNLWRNDTMTPDAVEGVLR